MLAASLAAAWLCARARAAEDAFPRAGAAYLVERDGRVLWEGRGRRRLPPASLAKMMLALLVIEDGRLDAPVVVSKSAAAEPPSKLGLRAGERFTTRALLTAAVVRSANDACRALADARGGQQAFVARMNARAASLGMRDTRFVDACGRDAPGQYTTVEDLARLARAAARRPEYLALSSLRRATIRALGSGRAFSFESTNALIGRYPGAVGLKTGTTPEAGTCLAALARRGKESVLVILLRARDRWWGADALLDRAFAAAPAAPAAP